MLFKVRKGTKLWHGNELIVLPANQTIDFVGHDSLDAIAEVLASHQGNFALNREALTHKEGKVIVSYGVAGTRIERKV